jgi:hypothetical protein
VEWTGTELLVKVEDFEAVTCDHAAGPSYILSAGDRQNFDGAVRRWQRGSDRRIYAIGYYRGHTRDGVSLAAEDLALLDDALPDPGAIALIVKPYATKVSIAGIFFRENGAFRAEASYLEFPFRRKELGGGSTGMDRLASAARFGQSRHMESNPAFHAPAQDVRDLLQPPEELRQGEPLSSGPVRRSATVRGWVWIPLSFIFMLLGTVLGFQIALSMRPKQPPNPWLEAWDLALTVRRTGEELTVTWDPIAPAVRNASRGALIIQSRNETRTIELRGTQLQGGSVVYKGVPEHVVFRLEVYPRERVVVSEIADFKREP